LTESPAWADHPDLVDFFTHQRCRPEDMYPSERRFLPWLAEACASVFDAGCAAGGFADIWRHFRPDISYTGLDFSVPLIDAAKRLHPGDSFLVGNAAQGVALPDRHSEAVQALGWMHWEPEYAGALAELWRVADRYLFFDLRLADRPEKAAVGRQKVAYTKEWDGKSTIPYIVVSWPGFAKLLLDLGPAAVMSYGYWGNPADTVVGIDERICFATFVLEKPPEGADAPIPKVCMDLPLPWPGELTDRVDLLPADKLESIVPAR
jgi:SAM-dependent methyltransferase